MARRPLPTIAAMARCGTGLSLTGLAAAGRAVGMKTPGAPPPAINDDFNRDQNKAISGYSRPLTSIISLNYVTPKISASGGAMKITSWLARDWQIGALLQYASGLPIHVPYAQNTPLLSTILARNLPVGITNTTYANRVPGQPLFLQDLNCHCFDPTRTLVLNPNAWVDPGPGQWGSSAPYYSDYRYQRRPGENVNIARIFHLDLLLLQVFERPSQCGHVRQMKRHVTNRFR